MTPWLIRLGSAAVAVRDCMDELLWARAKVCGDTDESPARPEAGGDGACGCHFPPWRRHLRCVGIFLVLGWWFVSGRNPRSGVGSA